LYGRATSTDALPDALPRTTLKECVNRIVARYSGLMVKIDPDIAERTLILEGEEYTQPELLLRAIASLLNLRFRKTMTGLVLERKSWNGEKTPQQFEAFLREVLPPSINTYLDQQPYVASEPLTMAANGFTFGPTPRILDLSNRALMVAAGFMPEILKQKKVRFKELPAGFQSAFALQFFTDRFLNRLTDMQRPTPAYIAYFPQSYITGGWKGEGKERSFSLGIVARVNGMVGSASFTTNGSQRFPER
jgi:hypothetical protein